MNKIYLQVRPSETVFCVFASVREGYDKNVVLACKVTQATVYEGYVEYIAKPVKVVTDKKDKATRYVNMYFRGNNIDTGCRGYHGHGYCVPTFTTKEKCIKWLRG